MYYLHFLIILFLNRFDKLADKIIIRQELIACLIFLERPDTAGKTGVTWVG